MPPHRLAFALLALPIASAGVSLGDFQPQASQLPPTCAKVYTQTINGCSESDWTSSSGCSAGCIEALSALTSEVQSACENQGIQGQNIIVAFLAGQGPQSLCSNAAVEYLASVSSSSVAVASTSISTRTSISEASSVTSQSSSTTFPTASTTESSNVISSTSAVSFSGVVTATSMATTAVPEVVSASSAILIDTSARPTASSTWSSFASLQTASGGGSPFDTENTNPDSMAAIHSTTFITTLVMLLSLTIAILR